MWSLGVLHIFSVESLDIYLYYIFISLNILFESPESFHEMEQSSTTTFIFDYMTSSGSRAYGAEPNDARKTKLFFGLLIDHQRDSSFVEIPISRLQLIFQDTTRILFHLVSKVGIISTPKQRELGIRYSFERRSRDYGCYRRKRKRSRW
jgi:hypothetical protein